MADTPTLDEISNMPQGQEELMQHLYDRGYATPPPPPPAPEPVFPDMTVSKPLTPPNFYGGARNQNFSMPISDTDLGGAPEMGGPSGAGRLDFKPMGPVQPTMPTPAAIMHLATNPYGAENQHLLGGGNLGPVQPTAEAAGIDISPEASPAPTPRAAPPAASGMYPPWTAGTRPAAPWAAGAPPAAAAPVPGAELNAPEISGMEYGGATPAIPSGLVKQPSMEMTKKEAGQSKREIGKLQYAAERPQITAPYGTEEFWNQTAAQKYFDLKHPLGADVSRMPGTKGKILHGLAMAGEIGGGAVAPGIVREIPGTRQNLGAGLGLATEEASRVGKEKLEKEKATSQMAEETARTAAIKQQTERAGTEEVLQLGPNGEVTGVKIGGKIHALTDPEVPQSVREVASVTEGKLIKPTVEKMENGDVLGITPGIPAIPGLPATADHPATQGTPAVPPSVQLLYHGDPKLETELTSRTVGGKEHHILVNKKTGEDVKDLGAFKAETSAAQNLAQMKHDETEMIAYDAKHNSYIAPYGQVNELGLQHPGKASPADRKNAEDATAALNEVGVKTLRMDKSLSALDQNQAQRLIIANGMSAVNRGDAASQILDSWIMRGATQKTQDFIIAAQNLREAVLALPKVVTGTSRMTDVQAHALWKTIVDGSARGSKYGHNQLYALDEMVARQWRKVPLVEGNPREFAFPEAHKGQPRSFEEGVGGKTGGGGGGEKTYTQADVTRVVATHPGSTPAQVEEAFKNKGYTKK